MLRAASTSQADVLYSDEDKIDESGYLVEPAFKPDWNYRLLLSCNYVCHLLMLRRTALLRAGPFNSLYNGAQDHDLVLRLSHVLAHDRFAHVPETLYHWRKTLSSTAESIGAKNYAIEAGITAVRDHLHSRGFTTANVGTALNGVTHYNVCWNFSNEPKVRIIIPFRDNASMTQNCLEQLLKRTAYSNFDVVLVDNWSTSPEAADLCQWAAQDSRMHVLRIEEDFNYSRLNNLAAAGTDAEFLLLLNNDVIVNSSGWLRALVDEAVAEPDVGAVGAKLLYANSTVQHAGVVLGLGGIAGHANAGLGADEPGYGSLAILAREVSAVTGAVMLVRTSAFFAVGGLDEIDLQVAFNDIDLCLKLRAAGWRIIWTPGCKAEHHESLSRGLDNTPIRQARFKCEIETMEARWGNTLHSDPHYSRRFDLHKQAYFDLVAPSWTVSMPGVIAKPDVSMRTPESIKP